MSGSNRTIKGIKGSRGSELNKTIRGIFARAKKLERAILMGGVRAFVKMFKPKSFNIRVQGFKSRNKERSGHGWNVFCIRGSSGRVHRGCWHGWNDFVHGW